MGHTHRLSLLAAGAFYLQLMGCGSRTFAPYGDAERLEQPAETVVLLHGQGRSGQSMYALAERLAQEGYRAEVVDYPSTQRDVIGHGRWLSEKLASFEVDARVSRIHFVTHSLGGIMTRQMLLLRRPEKLGRVVMIGPPNRGSASATRWAWAGGWIYGSLEDMSDRPDSYVNRMGSPAGAGAGRAGVEIGVIAGRQDGKVKIDQTHLDGEADHVVVEGYHTWLMNGDETFMQVLSFLKSGQFADPLPGGDGDKDE
jgi:triacylglycerol lipase